jgi:colicin import membrane protein
MMTDLDKDFFRNFLISLGGHSGFVLIAFLGGSIISDIFKTNQNVEIIRSSVRVDVVGMPKFTVKELMVMEALPKVAPQVATKGDADDSQSKEDAHDKINKGDLIILEEGVSKKKSSFMNIIADYSKKKVAPADKKLGGKSVLNKNLESLIIEGNRLSKGSALVGDFSDEQNSIFSMYVQSLPQLVRAHWKLPSYLMNQSLKCRIAIYLSPSGELLKTELIDSSGTNEFDARAEKAIRDAAPFPPPAADIAARLSTIGVILRFPL